jgi:hypothetical protein
VHFNGMSVFQGEAIRAKKSYIPKGFQGKPAARVELATC